MIDRQSAALGRPANPRGSSRSQSVTGWAAAALLAGTAGAMSTIWHPKPLLLWNATSSSAVGLYAIGLSGAARVGDTFVAWPPPSARRTAAARSYLPFDVPLVKRVAAIAGDRVCTWRNRIFINGRQVAIRRVRDPSGRTMSWWSGCVHLTQGELFLLSSDPLAFDGRYFGVTRASDVVGKARLLWRR